MFPSYGNKMKRLFFLNHTIIKNRSQKNEEMFSESIQSLVMMKMIKNDLLIPKSNIFVKVLLKIMDFMLKFTILLPFLTQTQTTFELQKKLEFKNNKNQEKEVTRALTAWHYAF